MRKIKKINKILIYVIAGLLILISGFSYAYFNGRVTGTGLAAEPIPTILVLGFKLITGLTPVVVAVTYTIK